MAEFKSSDDYSYSRIVPDVKVQSRFIKGCEKPKPLLVLFVCLCPCPLFATLGAVMMNGAFVVVGIDSQISGTRARITCKMRNNQSTVIISSGTYAFDPKYDYTRFDIFEADHAALSKGGTVEDVSRRLDEAIQPRYKDALLHYFRIDPLDYLSRYEKSHVAEFIVTGVSKDGAAMHKFSYAAPTPYRFVEDVNFRYPSVGKEQFRIATIPTIEEKSQPQSFWQVNASPTENLETAAAKKVREFIRKHVGPKAGVSEPIVIAIIDKNGFRLWNAGSCDASGQNH